MKVNAPEKIYLNPLLMEDGESIVKRCTFERQSDSQIEYIRTDAFIEKACEWIETNMDDYIHVEYDTVTGKPTNEAHIAHKKVVEDFKDYLKYGKV